MRKYIVLMFALRAHVRELKKLARNCRPATDRALDQVANFAWPEIGRRAVVALKGEHHKPSYQSVTPLDDRRLPAFN